MPFYSMSIPTPRNCWTYLTNEFPDIEVFFEDFSWTSYGSYSALVKVVGEKAADFLKKVRVNPSTEKINVIEKTEASLFSG